MHANVNWIFGTFSGKYCWMGLVKILTANLMSILPQRQAWDQHPCCPPGPGWLGKFSTKSWVSFPLSCWEVRPGSSRSSGEFPSELGTMTCSWLPYLTYLYFVFHLCSTTKLDKCGEISFENLGKYCSMGCSKILTAYWTNILPQKQAWDQHSCCPLGPVWLGKFSTKSWVSFPPDCWEVRPWSLRSSGRFPSELDTMTWCQQLCGKQAEATRAGPAGRSWSLLGSFLWKCDVSPFNHLWINQCLKCPSRNTTLSPPSHHRPIRGGTTAD